MEESFTKRLMERRRLLLLSVGGFLSAAASGCGSNSSASSVKGHTSSNRTPGSPTSTSTTKKSQGAGLYGALPVNLEMIFPAEVGDPAGTNGSVGSQRVRLSTPFSQSGTVVNGTIGKDAVNITQTGGNPFGTFSGSIGASAVEIDLDQMTRSAPTIRSSIAGSFGRQDISGVNICTPSKGTLTSSGSLGGSPYAISLTTPAMGTNPKVGDTFFEVGGNVFGGDLDLKFIAKAFGTASIERGSGWPAILDASSGTTTPGPPPGLTVQCIGNISAPQIVANTVIVGMTFWELL